MWKKKLLICPICKSSKINGEIPNLTCNSCDYHFNFSDTGILKTNVKNGLGVEFHEKMKTGTQLRKLQSQQLKLAFYESTYYKNIIKKWLTDIISDETVILDLGCGDGRFIELAIELGINKIVASDCNYQSLSALSDYASKNKITDKIFLILADAENIPLLPNSIDIILSIGVLYYLNENFENGLKCTITLLKERGYLIDSEPDLEGAALKALLFEGLIDFFMVITQNRFTETFDGESYKFRTFTNAELSEIYSNHNLSIIDSHGMSIFPSLLIIGMARGLIKKDEIIKYEKEIKNSFDYFDANGISNKHILRFIQKICK